MSGNNIGTVLSQLTKLAQLGYAQYQKVCAIDLAQMDIYNPIRWLVILHIVSVAAILWRVW